VGAGDFARARGRGATIRQIAFADYDHQASVLSAWVAPVEVDASSLFGRTTGPRNAAVITGVHSGEIGIFGAGAGGDATAVALLGDIAAIARDKAAILPAPILNSKFTILNSALREAV
jgi:homoserine dehydrogenase